MPKPKLFPKAATFSCQPYIDRIAELETGLENLKKHLEIVGGNAVRLSGAYAIVMKTLKQAGEVELK